MSETDRSAEGTRESGMTAAQAKTVELAIVGMSLASLIMLFQPFSLELYSIGAVLVVVAGFAFNLVPLARPGRPIRSLVKATIVIVLIFVVVTALALGSAELYAIYMSE